MAAVKNLKISAAGFASAVVIGLSMFGYAPETAASSPWQQAKACVWQVLEFVATEQPHAALSK